MLESFLKSLQIPMTREQSARLPQNAAFKYEYIKDEVWISPRPWFYHAQLDLSSFAPSEVVDLTEPLEILSIQEEHRPSLPPVFARAFQRAQPFASLVGDESLHAVQSCLDRTWDGGDGPFIQRCSFIAKMQDNVLGAILLTLLPDGDFTKWEKCEWTEPPPADCVEQGIGQPHLTWIFVDSWLAGRGIGTELLSTAVKELRALGYSQLISTFLSGNDSSMLWHWRNGFELLPHPTSWREMRRRWDA